MAVKKTDNIIFPDLSFDTPGIYKYTVREMTPPSKDWATDTNEYQVIITVTEGADGKLEAYVEYPDGRIIFSNTYKPDRMNVCKCFMALPFPMFEFLPPQKPEFEQLLKTQPNVFKHWEELIKNFA